jgi:SulP family sulfate permease
MLACLLSMAAAMADRESVDMLNGRLGIGEPTLRCLIVRHCRPDVPRWGTGLSRGIRRGAACYAAGMNALVKGCKQGFARLGPWVHELSPATWRADAMAGVLGALLVLPQGIAFAALAGLPPAMGLVASGLPCAVAALAGSSRHVMSGPTNATSLALGAMLVSLAAGDPHLLVPLALVLTLLVGLMQLALAVARLGVVANFISPSVMLGFTSGAAVLIAWYALGGLMGSAGRVQPVQAWRAGVSVSALLVGGLTLAVAVMGRRWWRRGPYMLVALAVGVVAAWACSQGAWIGGPMPLTVGSPPSAWPTWHAPWQGDWLNLATLQQLVPAAFALTIVALGQSIAIAKALAERSGQAVDLNRECMGQGMANVCSALGSGLVVCGSLNRSLPNLEAGARTPMAGVIAAGCLLALVALAGPLLAWIPLAGVSALLLVVAWGLIDRAAWRRLWQQERSELGVAAVTLLATLTVQLELAVLAGVMLSLVVYLYRSARPALRTMGFDSQRAKRPFVVLDDHPPGALPECPQLKLLRMEGSVWFGAVPHVAEHLRQLRDAQGQAGACQRHLLVMAKSMNAIDLAAADMWETERQLRREQGGDLYFHRPRPPVMAMWRRLGFIQRLGADHIFADKHQAIAAIVPRLDDAVCARCQVRLFDECSERSGAPLAPMI